MSPEERQRQASKQRRADLRAAGSCIDGCGAEAQKGRVRCFDCLRKHTLSEKRSVLARTMSEQDRYFARTILDAVDAYVRDAKINDRTTAVNTVAKALTDYRNVVLSCAVVRVEREFNVKARKK